MKSIIVFIVGLFTLNSYGQQQGALTDRLLENRTEEKGTWADETLTVNRIFIDGYHRWSGDSILNVLLPAILSERDSLIDVQPDEASRSAVLYHYGNGVFDLSNAIVFKIARHETWEKLADTITEITPFPTQESLASHPMANMYLQNLMNYELRELFIQSKEQGDSVFLRVFGVPVDSLKALALRCGEMYLTIPLSAKVLPKYAHERYLANQLMTHLEEKDLILSENIWKELLSHFSESSYLTACSSELDKLQEALIRGTQNVDIVFLEYSDSLGSVEKLINLFKGKVVYLDIWGTWCGPCVEEITQHTPALKAHFQDREDIVFLYLATEKQRDHEKWKQFIQLHTVSGYHMNMTDQVMEPLWVELLGTENVPRTYPAYAIFDRHGGLVTASAKRPSQHEALYLQFATRAPPADDR